MRRVSWPPGPGLLPGLLPGSMAQEPAGGSSWPEIRGPGSGRLVIARLVIARLVIAGPRIRSRLRVPGSIAGPRIRPNCPGAGRARGASLV